MRVLLALAVAMALAACSSSAKKSDAAATDAAASPSIPTVQSVEKMGNLETVKQFGELYFGGEPDATALKEFKKKGGTLIVDLRSAEEFKGKKAEDAAKKAGLKYVNVPVKKGEIPTADTVKKIDQVLTENPGGAFLHCSTGNRAATYLGLDLVQNKGVKVEDALRISKEVGLNSPAMIQKLEKAVGKQ